MLQVSYIRENREEVLNRLSVRNFKNPELVDQIIKLDDDRRQTQTLLDSIAAEANAAAKKVGELMRQGLKAEAEAIKTQTTTFKEQTRTLGDKLSAIEILLQAELVLLPNLPHQSVPKGFGADDNQVASEHGLIPQLMQGALPHWELAAKYDIIDFELGVKLTGAGFAKKLNEERTNIAAVAKEAYEFDMNEAEIKKVKDAIIENYKSQLGLDKLQFFNGQLKSLEDALSYFKQKEEQRLAIKYDYWNEK